MMATTTAAAAKEKKKKPKAAAEAAEQQQLREQQQEQEPKPTSPPRNSLPAPRRREPLPDTPRLRALVAAFAPVLRLHPDDAYMPCSAEWFASRSSLWWDGEGGEGGASRCLARLGECSFALALEKQRELLGANGPGAARRLRLSLDPLARGGQAPGELDEGVPLYVRAHLAIPPPPSAAEGGRWRQQPRLEITYLALYAFNGPYYPFSRRLGPGLGAHDGDLERVTVRLDAATGELVGCFFSAHRPRDGGWAPARDVERFGGGPAEPSSPFSPRGRLVAYVAKHGHGTYPTKGTQLRAGFFANDKTSSRGKAWAPRKMILLRAAGTTAAASTTSSSSSPKSGSSNDDDDDDGRSALAALLESPELGATVCRGCELEMPSSSSSFSSSSSSSSSPSSPFAMPPPTETGVVVVDDPFPGFSEFEGKFGEVLAARSQGWWARAECPVSRGTALRVVGHLVGEKETLYDK